LDKGALPLSDEELAKAIERADGKQTIKMPSYVVEAIEKEVAQFREHKYREAIEASKTLTWDANDPTPPLHELERMPPLNAESARGMWVGEKARTYDEGRESSEKWQREYQAVEKYLADCRGTVLDIPCGTGRFFEIYDKFDLSYIGMDVSEDMLVQAWEKLTDPLKATYGDIMDIPADDKEYDNTVCIRLLEKLPLQELDQAITEMCRVTNDALIAGLLVGKQTERRNRSWVHPLREFENSLLSNKFHIVSQFCIREPEYYVFACKRFKA
jgi:2-polyprenyl-3-methyl-5-hydroxy-6-metoxy-1,4-benzoquinol methylase